MQRNIIYILLFILFCQCTSTIRKDIKWIAITDIYEEFGIDSYDIEFEEFYFVDENTLRWCFKKYDTTLDVPIIDIKES